jgi:hypothetical protein
VVNLEPLPLASLPRGHKWLVDFTPFNFVHLKIQSRWQRESFDYEASEMVVSSYNYDKLTPAEFAKRIADMSYTMTNNQDAKAKKASAVMDNLTCRTNKVKVKIDG